MKLLDPEQVAEQLGISRSTARRMMIENAIPSICLRSGRRKKIYRVREEQLERFIIARERERASVRSRGTGEGGNLAAL